MFVLLTKLKPLIVVHDILVNEDVMESYFACDLQSCRGACCWEGDYGAPLWPEEVALMDSIATKILDFLPVESQEVINSEGASKYFRGPKKWGTNLRPDGACVFMLINAAGVAQCAIEKYQHAGLIEDAKPQSCHLYPVRVVQHDTFETLYYDRWDICSQACAHGHQEKIPLVHFVKAGLIRRYGPEFYHTLADIAEQWRDRKVND